MTRYLLAIDQGTTNSRAILFNDQGKPVTQYELPLKQCFPQDGWVEQDPEEMLANTITCCREAMRLAGIKASDIVSVGISNQRETTILWERTTGKPVYPAIVWQDRRTYPLCEKLADPLATTIQAKTGLLLDPYFSATKIAWILENVSGVREKANRGEILFGTVDTYLLWELTGHAKHVTDATNASRTMLFNIHTQQWDAELLKAFNIPSSLLPEVYDNCADFGSLKKDILGTSVPVGGMAGDQQAAAIGQACFQKGMVKATYGTGCFMLLNTGEEAITSQNKLLTSIAYRLNGRVTYCLEGSIFCAGVTIKWLRDTLNLIATAAETESLANSIADTNNVYLVPAFTGLGAPYWDPLARGALLGLTRDSNRAHIVRAALESVGYQSLDLLEAMQLDSKAPITTLRVDGGMAANQWLMQFIADILQVVVQRPACIETTALGAAYLAGLQAGVFQSLNDIQQHWHSKDTFHPVMPETLRKQLYAGWQRAVHKTRSTH